jgi:hypothetical protein
MALDIGSDDPQIIQAHGMMRGLSSHDMMVLRGASGDPVAIRHAEILSGGQVILAVLEYANDLLLLFRSAGCCCFFALRAKKQQQI